MARVRAHQRRDGSRVRAHDRRTSQSGERRSVDPDTAAESAWASHGTTNIRPAAAAAWASAAWANWSRDGALPNSPETDKARDLQGRVDDLGWVNGPGFDDDDHYYEFCEWEDACNERSAHVAEMAANAVNAVSFDPPPAPAGIDAALWKSRIFEDARDLIRDQIIGRLEYPVV